jgi:hypothetical protein
MHDGGLITYNGQDGTDTGGIKVIKTIKTIYNK